MFVFLFGFLSELGREIGAWLDRILPVPRLRRPLRRWRRRRPFWAAMWVIAGGLEMAAIPFAPLPLMIKVGVGAMSAVGIAAVLVAGGLFFLFKPDQRMFVSVVTAVASLTSMATTNLGGFGIGMLAGLVGSSMAFGWMPDPPDGPRDEDDPGPPTHMPATAEADHIGGGRAGVGPAQTPTRATWHEGDARTHDAECAADAHAHAAGRAHAGCIPRGREDRARSDLRPGRARSTILFAVSTVLAASALPAAAGTATAAPGTGAFPSPLPAPRHDTPSGGGTDPGGESAKGREQYAPGGAAQVALPCPAGIDTGELPHPGQGDGTGTAPAEAEPGKMPEDPDDPTALRPPVVIGGRPGRPRAAYPVNTVYPTVGSDSLTAYGAIIHGATYLRTADGGQLKVLWMHADRLVADNYTFRLETDGQTQTIDVDLDIPQVDVYVTRLTGSLTIPVIGVSTPRICIGADVVPANLPIAVQLPKLSVTAVEAGQVLVDAETVDFSDLSAHSGQR
ncbi:DUF6114 domain-containing protein [Streptomyces sp. NPDC020801]|uniref:DUF6114 domain-containing protein n=1 Tax=unclassified Streptomyces TaxID=2593676 RepID=UPI00378F3037